MYYATKIHFPIPYHTIPQNAKIKFDNIKQNTGRTIIKNVICSDLGAGMMMLLESNCFIMRTIMWTRMGILVFCSKIGMWLQDNFGEGFSYFRVIVMHRRLSSLTIFIK